MNQLEWESLVPQDLKNDVLWKVNAYGLALFLSEIAWRDTAKILSTQDIRGRSLADQLYPAVTSISANIAEGYSRSSGKERTHFYEYALGSARESRDWYFGAHHILEDKVSNHRIELLTAIIQLLLVLIPDQRQITLREAALPYSPTSDIDDPTSIDV
jgi:four helix bundle protein